MRLSRLAVPFALSFVAVMGCSSADQRGGGGDGGAGSSAGFPTSADGSGETTGPAAGPGSGSGSGSGGGASICVDAINQYRASLGLPAYARWGDAEGCADGQAASDSKSGQAHGAFGQCSESAQNECPGWPAPPESMIGSCLDMMWKEGPGADFEQHGHYINMSSTSYTSVACGFATAADGSIWAVQDFH